MVLAATGAEGLRENHSCERRLIGRADLVPHSCRFRATPFRLRCVALREPHPSSSQGRPGDQRLALKSGGHALQLVGRGPGAAEVAARDLDLDLRVEQRGPLQVGVGWQLLRRNPRGMLERVPYGGGCRGHVAARQAHQRETRLGLPPNAMRGQERLLGAVDVALAQPDPSELAERPSHLTTQVRTQLLAGHQRLSLRFVARTAQPQDLRPVHAAAPMEASDGIGLAPALHRLGPLLGHVVLRESLQRADELAVHEPGRERIEIPGDRRHSRLVEQRQTFLDIAAQDAQPSRRHSSDGARRGVASPSPPRWRARTIRERRSGRRSASARRCGRPRAKRARTSPADPRAGDPPGRASRARVPSARYPGAGASRGAPLRLPPRQGRRPERTGRACAPTPRWSRRAGRPRRPPPRAMADRPGPKPIRVGLHEEAKGLVPIAARRSFSRALEAHRTRP